MFLKKLFKYIFIAVSVVIAIFSFLLFSVAIDEIQKGKQASGFTLLFLTLLILSGIGYSMLRLYTRVMGSDPDSAMLKGKEFAYKKFRELFPYRFEKITPQENPKQYTREELSSGRESSPGDIATSAAIKTEEKLNVEIKISSPLNIKPPKVKNFSRTDCSKKLQELKLIEEDKLKTELEKLPLADKLKQNSQSKYGESGYTSALKHFLKTSVELNAKNHEKLFSIIEEVKNLFEIEANIKVFKTKEGMGENAFIISDKKEIILGFADNILNLVDDEDEIKTIIGHEFGHYVFNHNQSFLHNYILRMFNPQYESERSEDEIRIIQSEEGFELLKFSMLISQIQELNADRLGLFASKNFQASVQAIMKLSAGNVDKFGSYVIDDYLNQANNLLETGSYFEISDVLRTHPLEVFRAKALEYFYNTRMFFTDTNIKAKYKKNTINQNLSKLIPLDALNKERLLNSKGNEKEEGEYYLVMVIGALFVSFADDDFSKEESEFLNSSCRKFGHNKYFLDRISDLLEKNDTELFLREMEGLLEKFKTAPSAKKTSIIKHLIEAMKIDGKIEEVEFKTIRTISEDMNALEEYEKEIKLVFGV
ncbi:MAG: M48 family metalloprotease [Leptospiraceae bacterium]|nr:M48 family metalloprotease [Leptospiraceae bacterium]MCP5499659.1 M48 family metalloprotease [Leptospiraceae bacterium]